MAGMIAELENETNEIEMEKADVNGMIAYDNTPVANTVVEEMSYEDNIYA